MNSPKMYDQKENKTFNDCVVEDFKHLHSRIDLMHGPIFLSIFLSVFAVGMVLFK